MNASIAGLFAIIFLVLALNLYFVLKRIRNTGKRRKPTRVPVDEAKQALWREKEVARRIEREQDDALERVKLRNETLALYEVVRRRHAKDDESAVKIDESATETEKPTIETVKLTIKTDEPAVRTGAPFTSEDTPVKEDNGYENIGWGSFFLEDEPDGTK
jgi:hypothetical protein